MLLKQEKKKWVALFVTTGGPVHAPPNSWQEQFIAHKNEISCNTQHNSLFYHYFHFTNEETGAAHLKFPLFPTALLLVSIPKLTETNRKGGLVESWSHIKTRSHPHRWWFLRLPSLLVITLLFLELMFWRSFLWRANQKQNGGSITLANWVSWLFFQWGKPLQTGGLDGHPYSSIQLQGSRVQPCQDRPSENKWGGHEREETTQLESFSVWLTTSSHTEKKMINYTLYLWRMERWFNIPLPRVPWEQRSWRTQMFLRMDGMRTQLCCPEDFVTGPRWRLSWSECVL